MDDLRERVEAVERALTDGEGDLSALAEGAATAERVAELESTVAALREDVTDLEAATQALRGYVGNVRSVNEDVEQRADAAAAAVDDVEARLDRLEADLSDGARGAPGRGGEADPADTADSAARNGSVDAGATAGTPTPPASEEAEGPDGPTIEISAQEPASSSQARGAVAGHGQDGPHSHADEDARGCPTCGRGPGDGGSRASAESSPNDLDQNARRADTADVGAGGEHGSRAGRGFDAGDRSSPDSTLPSAGPGVDGFDPGARPEQVTLEHRDDGVQAPGRTPDPAGAPERDREGADGDGGLLTRARELL